MTSKGKQFKLVATSPNGVQGNAVTIQVNQNIDVGTLTLNGNPVQGNLDTQIFYAHGNYIDKYYEIFGFAVIFYLMLVLGLFGKWLYGYRKASRVPGSGLFPLSRRSLPKVLPLFGRYVVAKRGELAVLSVVFGLYMLVSPYFGTPDEYDNMLSGVFVSQGKLPYRDFFSHHVPFPYFLAGLISVFTKTDVWALRLVFLFILYLWSISNYILFKRFVSKAAGLVFLILLSMTAVIYLGHAILAETLVAYAAVTLCILLLYKYAREKPITLADVATVSGMTAIIIFSSLAYIYLVIFIYAVFGFLYIRQKFMRLSRSNTWLTLLILGVPYVFGFGIFVVTGSFSGGVNSFLFDARDFNSRYYAQFEPGIQVGLLRALAQVFEVYVKRIEGATHDLFNAAQYPAVFCLVAAISIVAYFLQRKGYWLAAFCVLLIALLSPRDDVFQGQPWAFNYHSTPYIVISVMFASIALVENLRYIQSHRRAVALRASWYVLALYVGFIFIGAANTDVNVAYTLLTEDSFNIISHEATPVAATMNNLSTPNDYVWLAPVDFQSGIYLHAKQATHYHFVFAWTLICGECRSQLMTELQSNRPKVIYWQPKTYDIDAYAGDVLDFMKPKLFYDRQFKTAVTSKFPF